MDELLVHNTRSNQTSAWLQKPHRSQVQQPQRPPPATSSPLLRSLPIHMCLFPRYFPDTTDGLPDLHASSRHESAQDIPVNISRAWLPTRPATRSWSGVSPARASPTMKTKAAKGKPINVNVCPGRRLTEATGLLIVRLGSPPRLLNLGRAHAAYRLRCVWN